MEWQFESQLILAGVLGLALLWLRALRLERPAITGFELQRQLKTRDTRAKRTAMFIERLPALQALRDVLALACAVVVLATLFVMAGVWWGIVIAFVGMLLIELCAKTGVVQRLSERLYHGCEPVMIQLTHRLGWLLRPFASPQKAASNTSFYSKAELAEQIRRDRSVLSGSEKTLLLTALDFESKTVADIMTRRRQMVTASARDTLGPLTLDRLHRTGHSAFPVVEKTADNIVGILRLSEIVTRSNKHSHIADAMETEVMHIQSDSSLEHALGLCLHSRQHMCIVLNAQSEVVGLVTLSDIIAQLLGRPLDGRATEVVQ